jgi:predicted DsbA family dithiol-disulfide isomerase
MPLSEPLAIDVVSDVVCPWCYVGKKRLEAALKLVPEIKTEVRWRPYQLDPTIPAEGIPRRAYMEKKFGSLEAIKPAHERLTALGQELGIPFNFSAIGISPNTLDAHRMIRWAFGGRQDAMVEALFRAFFVDAKNLADPIVLTEIGASAGFPREALTALLQSDEDAASVREEIAAAQNLGIQGVPFFIFGQKYAVSGAETAEHLASAIRQAAAAEPAA